MEVKSLIKAVRENDFDYVAQRLNSNESLFFCNQSGWTCFHFAASMGNIKMLQLLVSKMTAHDACEALSRETWAGETCLHVACSGEPPNADVVQYLLSMGLDPNLADAESRTPILIACGLRGNLEVVKALITMNADFTMFGGDPSPYSKPLYQAIMIGDLEIVEYLISMYRRRHSAYYPCLPVVFQTFVKNLPSLTKYFFSILVENDIRDGIIKFVLGNNEMADFSEEDIFHLNLEPNEDLIMKKKLEAIHTICQALAETNITLIRPQGIDYPLNPVFYHYFPELDNRPKTSLKTLARDALRLTLLKHYGRMAALNYFKNFPIPALRKYLMYETDPEPDNEILARSLGANKL